MYLRSALLTTSISSWTISSGSFGGCGSGSFQLVRSNCNHQLEFTSLKKRRHIWKYIERLASNKSSFVPSGVPVLYRTEILKLLKNICYYVKEKFLNQNLLLTPFLTTSLNAKLIFSFWCNAVLTPTSMQFSRRGQ